MSTCRCQKLSNFERTFHYTLPTSLIFDLSALVCVRPLQCSPPKRSSFLSPYPLESRSSAPQHQPSDKSAHRLLLISVDLLQERVRIKSRTSLLTSRPRHQGNFTRDSFRSRGNYVTHPTTFPIHSTPRVHLLTQQHFSITSITSITSHHLQSRTTPPSDATPSFNTASRVSQSGGLIWNLCLGLILPTSSSRDARSLTWQPTDRITKCRTAANKLSRTPLKLSGFPAIVRRTNPAQKYS